MFAKFVAASERAQNAVLQEKPYAARPRVFGDKLFPRSNNSRRGQLIGRINPGSAPSSTYTRPLVLKRDEVRRLQDSLTTQLIIT